MRENIRRLDMMRLDKGRQTEHSVTYAANYCTALYLWTDIAVSNIIADFGDSDPLVWVPGIVNS